MRFLYKNPDTLHYAIFHEILKFAFIYKKYDSLRYATILYTKIQTLRKKQDNLRCVFMYKNPDTLRYAIFMGFLKMAEGGGHFYMQKTMHFTLNFDKKNNALSVTFYLQKFKHYALHFYMQKNALCVAFLYLKLFV